MDGGGDDRYFGGWIANGAGKSVGAGLLADGDGDDTYEALDQGANGGAVGGIGFLLDAGGRDAYSDLEGGSGQDVTVLFKGNYGFQLDLVPTALRSGV